MAMNKYHVERCGGTLEASQLGVYRAFVDNYELAVETAEKCGQANTQFAEISEDLKVRTTKDCKDQSARNSLETLLYKPVDRVTRSTLVLHNRQLLKDGFMVELVEGARKLRHGPEEAEPPLTIPQVPDEELDAMKVKISHLRSEIQREKVVGPNKGSKVMERLRKKLSEQESMLLLTCPSMALRAYNRSGKSYTFLISSDYERAEWKEMIKEQQKKCLKSFSLTSMELQMLTSSCVKLQTVHSIPLTVNKEEDECPGLHGFLNVIVHSASGLKQSLTKTRVYRHTTQPKWNEEFEIDLEGSQTLRLLCYEKSYSKTRQNKDDWESADRIIGKGQIPLDPQALQGKDWQRTVIPMNGIEVKLSIKFTSREFSLKRMPSRRPMGVFGVKISTVTKRERSKVPYIVRQCLEEIERRGMEEVGIYRVSGDVSVMMSEMDVNAIAGTLKLYFRELPEPLFTDDLYPNFAGGITLSDSVAKESCMLNLLLSLPEPNLVTFLFLLDHLKREGVCEQDVAPQPGHGVSGPPCLRPSEKDSKIPTNPTQPISMGDSWSPGK
ncbi:hypothetical protein CRUP_008589 [Coryphaenoides rupestris]|nr:hypothetical protein CRUP_008589 [Coryphaenoides rupestris]